LVLRPRVDSDGGANVRTIHAVKKLILVVTGLLAFATARGQNMVCETYQLRNGMTVILHEDHALPVASVNIWYRVGSQDEPPGRCGFAHLFEHLMFMGTKRVPGNQFDVLMETGGGANNASTDFHRTNYYSWGPSKLLPTLLWLDADRLEDMALTMTDEKLGKQRDVVRNELRQVVENAPYGKAGEALYRLLYPTGHPMHLGVIGSHEDLIAATVPNVQDFFATFYTPNNASLVVAGDFDPGTIKPLIEDLFGTLPRGGEAPRRAVPDSTLDHVERVTMIDKVQLPKIIMGWPSVAAFGNGDAELGLAGRILADGNSSRLYQRLVVRDRSCIEVTASQTSLPVGSFFTIEAYCTPEADLDAVEAAIDAEVALLSATLAEGAEVQRNVNALELAVLASLQSIEAKADKLNEYQYFFGDPNGLERDLNRYRSATPESISRVVAETLKPRSRAIIRVLPEDPERGPSPRDVRPEAAGTGTFKVPAPTAFTLANGLPVLLWPRNDLPLVAAKLLISGNGALDPTDRPGLTSLTASMLTEGAGGLDSAAFTSRLQALGAAVGAQADEETFEVSLLGLKRTFAESAKLFADCVMRPALDEEDFDRVKVVTVEGLEQENDEPRSIARKVGMKVLLGSKNPYSSPASGTPQSVRSMTLDEVKARHAGLAALDSAVLLLSGDLTESDVRAVFEPLFAGRVADVAATSNADFTVPTADAQRLIIVDRPGATQTMITFLMPGAAFEDPRRIQLGMINTIFGGSFTSRLNQNLREDHGYTYGARSSFGMQPSLGVLSAGASVQAEVTGAALSEFFKEFARILAGDISVDEAAKARETVRNDAVRGFSSVSGVLDAASELIAAGLPFETLTRDFASMNRGEAKDLNTLASQAIAFDRAVIVLVGDKAQIVEQIKEFESKDLVLPVPEFLTPDGLPIEK